MLFTLQVRRSVNLFTPPKSFLEIRVLDSPNPSLVPVMSPLPYPERIPPNQRPPHFGLGVLKKS